MAASTQEQPRVHPLYRAAVLGFPEVGKSKTFPPERVPETPKEEDATVVALFRGYSPLFALIGVLSLRLWTPCLDLKNIPDNHLCPFGWFGQEDGPGRPIGGSRIYQGNPSILNQKDVLQRIPKIHQVISTDWAVQR